MKRLPKLTEQELRANGFSELEIHVYKLLTDRKESSGKGKVDNDEV